MNEVATKGMEEAKGRLAAVMGAVPGCDEEASLRALAGYAARVLAEAADFMGRRQRESEAGFEEFWDAMAVAAALRVAGRSPAQATAPSAAAVAALLRWRAQELAEEGDVACTVASAAVRDLAKSWDTYDATVDVASVRGMLMDVASTLHSVADDIQQRLAEGP